MFFLEFWKRKEVTLAYHWDVLEYEEEEVKYSHINHLIVKESIGRVDTRFTRQDPALTGL